MHVCVFIYICMISSWCLDRKYNILPKKKKKNQIANWAAMYSSGDYLVFLKPNVIPLKGWLYELLQAHHATRHQFNNAATSAATFNSAGSSSSSGGGGGGGNNQSSYTRFDGGIVGSVVLYPSGKVFSSGFEYFDTPIMNPSETKSLNEAAARGNNHLSDMISGSSGRMLNSHNNNNANVKTESGVVLPHHKLRGYHARDLRISPSSSSSSSSSSQTEDIQSSLGVSRHCLFLSRNTFFDLHGFEIGYSSAYEDADMALRLIIKYKHHFHSLGDISDNNNGLVVTAVRSRVVSMNPEGYPELDNS
jgi:hypothetical protein